MAHCVIKVILCNVYIKALLCQGFLGLLVYGYNVYDTNKINTLYSTECLYTTML